MTSAAASARRASDALARASRLQPALRCFVEIGAPADAVPGGRLAGIPYAAKDMFDLPGRPAGWGLAARQAEPPAAPAAVLRTLDAEGAVRIGLTTMTALAYEPSGANEALGRPLNPRDPDLVCGGSSSGSAVAVAAGIVPLAIGSDTGGSLRIPAQACGVAAWKPSFGCVPTEGAMPLAPSLDTIGFLADDPALLARVAALFGPRPERPIRNVALAADVLAGCDPAVAATARSAGDAVASLGCAVAALDVLPLLARCDGPALTIMQVEAAEQHRGLLDSLPPVLTRRLAKGVAISSVAAAQARRELDALRAADPSHWLGGADAVMLPVMRMPTPEIELCEPGSPRFSARALYGLSSLTRFVNVLGWPAVALPWGRDGRGAPLAVQIVGRPASDLALLDLAERLWASRREGAPNEVAA